VSLKSALDLLLHDVGLTYVIKAEVLQITTELEAKGKLETRTFPVGDLVLPVKNTKSSDLKGPYQPLPGVGGVVTNGGPTTPVQGPNNLSGGIPTGVPAGSTGSPGSTGGTAPGFAAEAAAGMPPAGPQVNYRGQGATREAELIKLIKSTVSPRSWDE